MFYKHFTTFNLLTLLPAITLAGSLDSGDPASGTHPQSDICKVKGETNLRPENIRAGITIFGITGTFTGTTTSTPPPSSSAPTPRYTDNEDGTITDNQNGLIWLKNANCYGEQSWETAMQSAAHLASRQCGLSDKSKAGMWRLPTKEEWEAMVDKSIPYPGPMISNAAGTGKWTEGDAFLGVSSWYWSSSTRTGGAASAWDVYLSSGYMHNASKTSTSYVWPVRGGL